LLKAIIGSQGEQVSWLQHLWGHVDLFMGALHSVLGDGIWCADQDQLILRMLEDGSDVLTFDNGLIRRLSNEMNLDMHAYYPHLKELIAHMAAGGGIATYQEMQDTTHCTRGIAKRMWQCMAVIEQSLQDQLVS